MSSTEEFQKAEQAENKLRVAARAAGVSEDGFAWLDLCLDPFKDDVSLNVKGFPDLITTPSVIQVVKQTLTIRVPALVPAGQNWDCNIVMTPALVSYGVQILTFIIGNIFDMNAPTIIPQPRGGIEIYANLAGAPMGYGALFNNLAVPLGFVASATRCLGMAMEIHNTTAEINLQGAVCLYRMPLSNMNEILQTYFYGNSTNPAIAGAISSTNYLPPPQTISQAQLLPYSRQWEAKFGAYCVNTMGSQTNQPQIGVFSSPWTQYIDNAGTQNVTQQTVVLGNKVAPLTGTVYAPFNFVGAYFTGLSYQSTLTINGNWILERFPTPANTDLVVLATPSPSYDPHALQMYAQIAAKLPPGVKVYQNDIGDWISTIADIAGNFGIPGMGLVKGAVDVGRKVIQGTGIGQSLSQAKKRNKRARQMGVVSDSPWNQSDVVASRVQAKMGRS